LTVVVWLLAIIQAVIVATQSFGETQAIQLKDLEDSTGELESRLNQTIGTPSVTRSGTCYCLIITTCAWYIPSSKAICLTFSI
jgi:hypothetical protein